MRGYRKDLTGQRFGRLTVIRATDQRVRSGKSSYIVYECLCDCGNTCFVCTWQLTAKGYKGKKSCGCLNKETGSGYIHGGSRTPLYHVWDSMKARCNNPKNTAYKDYGGRGIRVCAEWQNDFEVFRDWALSNGYKEDLSIDRIDVNGNYCPENCRWITIKEQQSNKRSTIRIEYNGETHTILEWSQITGIKYITLFQRIKAGWPTDKALNAPPDVSRHHKK